MSSASRSFASSVWLPRLSTAAVWALVAASAVFWWLQQPVREAVPTALATHKVWGVDAQGLARLLGAQQVAVAEAAPAAKKPDVRYALVGVMAGAASGQGAALIAIDGQSARMYRVGSQVGEGGPYLQRLFARSAQLGPSMQAPATMVLELPDFSPAPRPAAPAAATAATALSAPAPAVPAAAAATASTPRGLTPQPPRPAPAAPQPRGQTSHVFTK